MECVITYQCDCSNRKYPSPSALKAHKKTQIHKSWENETELKELKIILTRRDNEIVGLKNNLENLRELNTKLLHSIFINKISIS